MIIIVMINPAEVEEELHDAGPHGQEDGVGERGAYYYYY